jgi:RNA polymerase sigma factor (sigma-70 family)
LLQRFVSSRDEKAFTGLVHRHARLVWAICRQLTHSDADADDAFQATFLVLIRDAGKVRNPGKLSAWLHGVAYKVCAKARQSSKRRVIRERNSVASCQNGSPVPDSAWDRALAAVHEEVARLPETIRAPFVLCCLEGKSVTEAAEQLGCKLSALSARLARAKCALQARLESRGVAIGLAAVTVAVTAGAASHAPAAVLSRAAAWVRAGAVIPESILQLSEGVMTMSLNKVKILAAGLCIVCGLGLGGVRWLSMADAQDTSRSSPAQGQADYETQRPSNPAPSSVNDWPTRMFEASEQIQGSQREEAIVGNTARWEYDFVLASEMGTTKFVQFLKERESRGWEFNGEATLQHEGRAAAHWVFRRPRTQSGELATPAWTTAAEEFAKWTQLAAKTDRKSIEAEIRRLQAQSKKLDESDGRTRQAIRLPDGRPETVTTLVDLFQSSSAQKFGAGKLKLTFNTGEKTIYVEGSPEVVNWATDVAKKLFQQK